MEKTTAVVICLAILVVAFGGFFLWPRAKGVGKKQKGKLRGPFGMGMEVEESTESAPQQGVDLSDAEFKDKNKFTADNEARVKAKGLKAGSGNEFNFGDSAKPTERDNGRK